MREFFWDTQFVWICTFNWTFASPRSKFSRHKLHMCGLRKCVTIVARLIVAGQEANSHLQKKKKSRLDKYPEQGCWKWGLRWPLGMKKWLSCIVGNLGTRFCYNSVWLLDKFKTTDQNRYSRTGDITFFIPRVLVLFLVVTNALYYFFSYAVHQTCKHTLMCKIVGITF